MIYSETPCKWCGKIDWTVKITVIQHTETEQHVCIPCLFEAHQDCKDKETIFPTLYLVK
jgi:hypothetical protein